jgi:hypothetical protein
MLNTGQVQAIPFFARVENMFPFFMVFINGSHVRTEVESYQGFVDGICF